MPNWEEWSFVDAGEGALGFSVSKNEVFPLPSRNQWLSIFSNFIQAVIDATTRNLALGWGSEYGIRVNGIAPVLDINSVGTFTMCDKALKNLKKGSGTSVVVDGGLWMSGPRPMPKDTVRQAVGFDGDVREQEDAKELCINFCPIMDFIRYLKKRASGRSDSSSGGVILNQCYFTLYSYLVSNPFLNSQDLLQPQQRKSVGDVGEEYFNEPLSRLLFQQNMRIDPYEEMSFVMHDLVNDLAKFVS
ncbi:hypothetical protein FNV43_RR20190 [Rhamnella rubrinervis]|uniref:Disease resistance protein winged helix domain-containing protein n=1 Tax=Rhamnella rubrinervis TaxID=2594499 RepID=A0A8K0E5Z0_9ROSA|nr:hypothetical protein FNV43_RR20190 [Rhamnella rubrinervis]